MPLIVTEAAGRLQHHRIFLSSPALGGYRSCSDDFFSIEGEIIFLKAK
jgi:hypothetical protein